jgi:hypothetical protein
MTQLAFPTLSEGSRRRFAAGALAATLIAPTQAPAFFQQTSLEGTLGTDVGGVWLSIQNIVPEFRISYPKPTSGPAVPIEVGPVTPDLHSLVGDKPLGVLITKCVNETFCTENGVMVGDVIVEVNSRPTPDQAAWQEATSNAPQMVQLSIRRPALKMSTARLFKLKYGGGQSKGAGEGTSAAEETLDIRLLDVALPLDEKVEKSRTGHELVVPTEAELETIGKTWAEMPAQKPLRYATGKHRFVSKSAYDESLLADKSLQNASFAVVMDLKGNPGRGGGGQVIDVYGIESLDSKKISGSYVSVTMANAPFPINIEFKGRFEMTKVAEWSDQDDKLRAAEEAKRPKEDLDKIKTLPDVPAPAKPVQ